MYQCIRYMFSWLAIVAILLAETAFLIAPHKVPATSYTDRLIVSMDGFLNPDEPAPTNMAELLRAQRLRARRFEVYRLTMDAVSIAVSGAAIVLLYYSGARSIDTARPPQ